MRDQDVRIRITSKEAATLWEWFLFQEENNIHKEPSSIKSEEVNLASRIRAGIMKLQKRKGGGYIYMPASDAAIARSWAQTLPKDLMDKADHAMVGTLNAFLAGNYI